LERKGPAGKQRTALENEKGWQSPLFGALEKKRKKKNLREKAKENGDNK
jgi:hypothetical protein